MKRIPRFWPSPALVVACLALLVALGGVGYAATALPRNSVGTPQLKKNAVTSIKVKDRSLLARDFQRGQLPRGPRGLRGLTGAQGAQGAKGDKGDTGAAGAAGRDAFADVGVAASEISFTTSSATFVDVPNATTTVTVPAGRTATILAYFSAESTCSAGEPVDWCSVRILVDGTEMEPSEGTSSAFDSVDDGNSSSAYEHNALVRHATAVGPGVHTVKVQAAVVQFGVTAPVFRLDDLSLAVQAIED